MFKQSLLLVAFIASLLLFVKADQIIIYSPPRNAVYNAKDIMDLRYKVRFIGMTKYWSANTSLVHLESNTLVSNFTNLKWVAGKNESESSIHDVWNIPGDIKNGTYAFIVTANSTQPCSKTNDGKAPFTRCDSVLEQNVTLTIVNNA